MSNTNGRFVDNSKVAPSKWEQFKKKVFPFVKKHRKTIAYISLCLAIAIGSRIQQANVDKQKYEYLMEQQKAELVEEYEARIIEMRDDYMSEISALRAEYEYISPEEQIKEEGEYIAKVLHGMRYNSERDLRTAVWCILNRVDTVGYPGSVQGVCQQEHQWIGYSDDNPILTNLYEIAVKELDTWHSGYRPVNSDYVYLSWSSKEIVLRDTYEKTANTRYWQAG
jgi:hypothetical protein